jgi:acyl transferase domain-containing protein
MMAAGLGPDIILPYLDGTSIQVACINSPQNVTLSGNRKELVGIEKKLKDDGHFARILLVDAAYHSRHMAPISDIYQNLLEKHVEWRRPSARRLAVMFSSVNGKAIKETLGPEYWVKNMVPPVLFSQAVGEMITTNKTDTAIDYLIEIGPSNSLSGPVKQIIKAVASYSSPSIKYTSAWKR